jgi:hypothetical protein
MSFWFYLDSFPPSTSSSYNKATAILSYGDNPCIKYDSPTNTLLITVKQDSDKPISIVDMRQSLEKNIATDNSANFDSIQEQIKNTIEKVKAMPVVSELDSEGDRLIYRKKNVLLQKWNNIVINYYGGTLDIFYNGELVKSAIEVVPYIQNDILSVGTNNGISGNIANLMYFNKPIDYLTINTLYTSLKDSSPPSISTNKENIIPIK